MYSEQLTVAANAGLAVFAIVGLTTETLKAATWRSPRSSVPAVTST
jgi:hypothetical protein